MRILASLLLPLAALALTPKDEGDIRIAIQQYAKNENLKGTGQVWSERGPLAYKVRTIEEVTADVATADADGWRTGVSPQYQHYVFILTRTEDHWSVRKKVKSCGQPGIQLIDENDR